VSAIHRDTCDTFQQEGCQKIYGGIIHTRGVERDSINMSQEVARKVRVDV